MWVKNMLIIIRKKSFIYCSLITVVILSLMIGVKLSSTAKTVSGDFTQKSYIALIIDDFGNHGDGTEEMLKLDIPITAAVMPFLPSSRQDAEAAHKAGKDVILHIPMEPVKGKRSWLGPMPITSDLSDEEVQKRIKSGLEEVKWAVGVNNHMGSKIMQDERILRNIIAVSRDENLLFIDSKTTEKSVASTLANEYQIPFFSRDVFLDSTQNKKTIEKRLLLLGKISLERGYSIGIGHVGASGGKVTVEAIKSVSPILQKQGIEFITISKLKELAPDIVKKNKQKAPSETRITTN